MFVPIRDKLSRARNPTSEQKTLVGSSEHFGLRKVDRDWIFSQVENLRLGLVGVGFSLRC